MKRALLLATALAALSVAADARVITYTWHQTSTTLPGLTFTAYYKLMQGVPPLHADSTDASPDFGGLLAYYIDDNGMYPALSLSNLVPSCFDSSGCDIGGSHHDFGSPNWSIQVPHFFYTEAISSETGPLHFEWSYVVTATSIQLNDDNANSPCFQQFGCYAEGTWVANDAPEPMTLLAFAGGLLGLSLLRRRYRG